MFDPEKLKALSSAPLGKEQIGSFGEEWEEKPEYPPMIPAGKYRVLISNIHDDRSWTIRKDEINTQCFLDFSVHGGEYDGRTAASFQQVQTKAWNGRSTMGDLINSAARTSGASLPCSSIRDMATAIDTIRERSMPFYVQLDWEGFDLKAWNDYLMEATKQSDAGAAKAILRGWGDSADDSQKKQSENTWREAKKVGLAFRSARDFPDNPNGGGKQDWDFAPISGNRVRARGKITRYPEGGN
jgi:hypothetical protein